MNKKNALNAKSNELADWFVKNKIVENLFGPNLHVEVYITHNWKISLANKGFWFKDLVLGEFNAVFYWTL